MAHSIGMEVEDCDVDFSGLGSWWKHVNTFDTLSYSRGHEKEAVKGHRMSR